MDAATPTWSRRRICLTGAAALAALGLGAVRAAEPERDPRHLLLQDFDELWHTLAARYCFFEQKATDWQAVRATYRPLVTAVDSVDALRTLLGRVLGELYDPHTSVAGLPDGAPRAAHHDLWVRPDGEAALVEAVRDESQARAAGLRAGDRILAVDGTPLPEALAAHRPRCLARPDPAADEWACNVAVAGRRGAPRRLFVSPAGRGRAAAPRERLLATDPPARERADLEWRRHGEFGWIRIASFADAATVERFDAALEALRDSRGLAVDVRRNGGGDTQVARPIMGRFVREPAPYARMRRRAGDGLGPAWTEYVEPRGPFTYERPVVVLTDRWSASMAEGFPMGMRGLGRARIVGTRMMRLGAAVFPLRLDRSGVDAQYSAEPVYDVDDRPRWEIEPDVPTAPEDDILARGLAELRRLAAARGDAGRGSSA